MKAMNDTEKIIRTNYKLGFTVEAIDKMIEEEEKKIEKYKKQYKEEYLYSLLELNLNFNLINLQSIKARLIDAQEFLVDKK